MKNTLSQFHMTRFGGEKKKLSLRFMVNGKRVLRCYINGRLRYLKRSPGSVVEIEVLEIDGNVYFHRFFCALKTCIDGFLEGCRPHLSIDSTALNGRWNGHLASATAVDGHNWMYPLAFGFIASETEDNWTWFMNQLKMAIGDPPLLAVCTDACKGLENAANNVFTNAEQR